MHILIISDAYPPETRSSSQLMKDLASGLKKEGHRITVITSMPASFNVENNHKILEEASIEKGTKIIRTKIFPHHNVNLIQKGIAQFLLPILYSFMVKKHVKEKIDVIWLHMPPLTLTITARIIKKQTGAKFILNLHDFFPQNAIDLGILKNKLLIWYFKALEIKALKNADLIVVPSIKHCDFLINNYQINKNIIYIIPHWVETSIFDKAKNTGFFRKKLGLEGKFIFVFGGIMGPSQGLGVFIRIAEKLKKFPDIAFLFVGEGSHKTKLIKLAHQKKLNNITFSPIIPFQRYPSLLKECDVGILSLKTSNTTPILPAKIIGYMASGLPILAFLSKNSSGIEIVKSANCGLASSSSNEHKLLKLTKQIYLEKTKLISYQQNGIRYAKKHFSKTSSIKLISKLIKSIYIQ